MAVDPEKMWTDFVQPGLALIASVIGAVIAFLAYRSYAISTLPCLT